MGIEKNNLNPSSNPAPPSKKLFTEPKVSKIEPSTKKESKFISDAMRNYLAFNRKLDRSGPGRNSVTYDIPALDDIKNKNSKT